MKKILFTIMLFVLGLGLIGCKPHVRELPIKSTLIYRDCMRYDTIPNWDIINDNPDYVICTNRYTNEEETIAWEDYLKSNDINLFIKDVLDDLDDEFTFLEIKITELQEKIDELNKELEKVKEAGK